MDTYSRIVTGTGRSICVLKGPFQDSDPRYTGVADTRSIQHDELHKKSITDLITKQVDSITAVLILINGTVPRCTVGIDDMLSTLSAVFPEPFTSNIAFVFTNISTPFR